MRDKRERERNYLVTCKQRDNFASDFKTNLRHFSFFRGILVDSLEISSSRIRCARTSFLN